MQEIQCLEFMGGFNSVHAHSNYLICMCFYSNKYGNAPELHKNNILTPKPSHHALVSCRISTSIGVKTQVNKNWLATKMNTYNVTTLHYIMSSCGRIRQTDLNEASICNSAKRNIEIVPYQLLDTCNRTSVYTYQDKIMCIGLWVDG